VAAMRGQTLQQGWNRGSHAEAKKGLKLSAEAWKLHFWEVPTYGFFFGSCHSGKHLLSLKIIIVMGATTCNPNA